MKKYRILQCLCINCSWLWEVLSMSFNANKEQCPNCKSFYVKTILKRGMPESR